MGTLSWLAEPPAVRENPTWGRLEGVVCRRAESSGPHLLVDLAPPACFLIGDLGSQGHLAWGHWWGSIPAQATGPSDLQVWTQPRMPVSPRGHGWPRAEPEAGLVLLASSGLTALTCNPLGIFESEGRSGCLGPRDRPSYPSCVVYVGLDPPPGGSPRPQLATQ